MINQQLQLYARVLKNTYTYVNKNLMDHIDCQRTMLVVGFYF